MCEWYKYGNFIEKIVQKISLFRKVEVPLGDFWKLEIEEQRQKNIKSNFIKTKQK